MLCVDVRHDPKKRGKSSFIGVSHEGESGDDERRFNMCRCMMVSCVECDGEGPSEPDSVSSHKSKHIQHQLFR